MKAIGNVYTYNSFAQETRQITWPKIDKEQDLQYNFSSTW
jgi:hypothetical protein